MEMYSAEEYAVLRENMALLPPGQLIFITDRELEPAQLTELNAMKDFMLVVGRENSGDGHFYCIAHVEDTQLALETSAKLIKGIGGMNMEVSQFQ
jgi:hypothetical protein